MPVWLGVFASLKGAGAVKIKDFRAAVKAAGEDDGLKAGEFEVA